MRLLHAFISSRNQMKQPSKENLTICFNRIVETSWLEKAKAALSAGDSSLAADILSKLDDRSVTTVKTKESSTSSTSTRVMAKFAPGKTTETELVPLTPYWDDHMCKLDIHIPLTVFDVDWITRDLLVAVKKASKNKDRPTGQLPKSEWWMSYADWTRSTRLFLEYLREVYHHNAFADALEKHFNYVVKLDEQHCWVTAFRYDIAVRSNVMCHHVEGAVADPSVKRPIFLESAKAKTDSFKDGWLVRHDNRKHNTITVEAIQIED